MEPYKSLKCSHQTHGHEQQETIDTSSSNHISGALEGAPMPTTLATTTSKGYEVHYRFSRRFGMIVQIMGFLPYKEK